MQFELRKLGAIFPDDVIAVFSSSPARLDELYPTETEAVDHASNKRKTEFAAGRLVARKALEILGVTEFPLLMSETRNPQWPSEFVGSITHANGCAAAAVGLREKYRSIGLDIEEVHRLKPHLWKMTIHSTELTFLENLGKGGDPVPFATTFFAIKEAFYKFQFPLTQKWLGFKDVEVSLNVEKMMFEVKLLTDLNSDLKAGAVFPGKYIFFDHFVAVGIVW